MAAFTLAAAALTSSPHAAGADAYPTRPIRMVVSGTGGSSNFTARIVAPGLSAAFGQQVIVDNRGSGLAAIETVAHAQADGYTLLFVGSTLWLMPYLRTHVPYDPVRDFVPISLAIKSPNILVVHPSLPATSVRELIDLARAKPGVLNYATSGPGNSNHIAGELFKAMAGIDMMNVNYKGAAPALSDVIAGQVQVMFPTAASVTAHVAAGRLRALAVTSPEPSPLLPGLVTVSSSGLPGYESESMFGALGPTGMPHALVDRLSREIARVLTAPDIRERLLKSGVEVVAGSPEQFGATMKAEMARLGKVIREAGIRSE